MDKETRFSSNNHTLNNINSDVNNVNTEFSSTFIDNNDLNKRQRSDLRRNLKSDQNK